MAVVRAARLGGFTLFRRIAAPSPPRTAPRSGRKWSQRGLLFRFFEAGAFDKGAPAVMICDLELFSPFYQSSWYFSALAAQVQEIEGGAETRMG
jgi:hypothetical protein